jgi:MazG family protein
MDARLEQLARLAEIVDRLRAEDGCPWDREQTLKTLAPCAQEEAAEVADAIAEEDTGGVQEELGDLLMNVFLMSKVAEQDGQFELADVARTISDKLIRRHPHVFGDLVVKDADEVLENWERIKQSEKAQAATRKSVLDGVPAQASALLQAGKLVARAAGVGFDWKTAADALGKVREELGELLEAIEEGPEQVEAELGDVLFSLVCAARLLQVDADLALRKACGRFQRRFRFVEETIGAELRQASLAEMEAAWQKAKAAGL